MKKTSKRVLTFGTFDFLHLGHESYLKQAKEYGDILVVVVARDSTAKYIKGRFPVNDEQRRLDAVRLLSYVDKAVLGKKGDKYKIIEEIRPDVICLGYDQKPSIKELRSELNKRSMRPEIARLKPYKRNVYKSSRIRKRIG